MLRNLARSRAKEMTHGQLFRNVRKKNLRLRRFGSVWQDYTEVRLDFVFRDLMARKSWLCQSRDAEKAGLEYAAPEK